MTPNLGDSEATVRTEMHRVVELPAEIHTELNRRFPKSRLDIVRGGLLNTGLKYENISLVFAVDYFRLCLRILGFGPIGADVAHAPALPFLPRERRR